MKEPLEYVRLDRWLMAARFYKTRSQAAAACNGRKVKLRGTAAKPHSLVHIGDLITVHHHDRYRNIEVLGLAERGLPPLKARELYHEEAPSILSDESREIMDLIRKEEKKNRSPKTKGRPTKRIRRQMDEFHDRLHFR